MSVNVGSAVGYLDLDIAGFVDGFKEAQEQAKKSTKSISEQVTSAMDSIGGGLQSVGDTISKAGTFMSAAITLPVVTAVTASVNEFAKLEQAVGGIETMFKKSASAVIDNAETAYKRAGVSSVEYMEQITSFSASLLQGLGGNTKEAARIADIAMVDMSDSANKFGTNIGLIQNAYQGFAKANYTMLDNLKLGYGGTKEEMARMLEDASKIAGTKFKISNFDDIIEAIHVIQTELGVAGTTAKEASTTISGSFGMTKASLKDLMAGFGDPEANIKQLMDNLIESTKIAVTRLKEVLSTIWDNIPLEPWQKNVLAFTVAAGPALLVIGKLVSGIGGFINTISLVAGALTKIQTGFAALSATTTGAGTTLGASFAAALGPITLIIAAIAALAAAFVNLWKTNESFRNNITATWNSILDTVKSFTKGVVDRFKALNIDFEKIVEVIKTIWEKFCEFMAPIFEGAFSAIANVVETALGVITGILDVFIGIFTGNWEQAWEGIKGIATSIWDGIVNGVRNSLETIGNVINVMCGWFGTTWQNVWNGIKTFMSNLLISIATSINDAYTGIVTWATNMVTTVLNMCSAFVNNIYEFFTSLPYNLGYLLGVALGTIVEWSVNMVNSAIEMGGNFIDAVVSFFSELPKKISSFINNAYNKVLQWSTNMKNKATETGRDFIDNVITFIKELPGKIKSWFDKTIEKAIEWADDMGRKGMDAIRNLIDNVVEGAKAIPGKMLEIGKNIVNGVWEGISSMYDEFKENVSDFFGGIVDGVKDALGINSPSKVMADEIGRWLPAGVAQGFKTAMPDAMNDIEKSLNSGINKVSPDDISVPMVSDIDKFVSAMKGAYNSVAVWFESIESRLDKSITSMSSNLLGLAEAGMLAVDTGGFGYVGYNGYSTQAKQFKSGTESIPVVKETPDIFVFNSPKAIDEVEAARQMKRAKRDMSEDF